MRSWGTKDGLELAWSDSSCVELFGTITTSDELSCSEKTRVNQGSDEEAFEIRGEGGDWRE